MKKHYFTHSFLHEFLNDPRYHSIHYIMGACCLAVFFLFGVYLSLLSADQYAKASFFHALEKYSDVGIVSIEKQDEQSLSAVLINDNVFDTEVLVQWSASSEDKGFSIITLPALQTTSISLPLYDTIEVIVQSRDTQELTPVDNVRAYYSYDSL